MPRLSRPTPNLHVVPPPATPKRPITALERLRDAFFLTGVVILYVIMAFALILPALFLLEVYLAFRFGGPHITVVLIAVAVLIGFAMIAGWIATWRESSAPRLGKHVHVYHHRNRW